MRLPILTLRLYRHEKDGVCEEIHGHGYLPKVLDPSGWVEQECAGTYPTQYFRFTGPAGWVRGWYMTRPDGSLFYHEAFDPFEVKTDGDVLNIQCAYDVRALSA